MYRFFESYCIYIVPLTTKDTFYFLTSTTFLLHKLRITVLIAFFSLFSSTCIQFQVPFRGNQVRDEWLKTSGDGNANAWTLILSKQPEKAIFFFLFFMEWFYFTRYSCFQPSQWKLEKQVMIIQWFSKLPYANSNINFAIFVCLLNSSTE